MSGRELRVTPEALDAMVGNSLAHGAAAFSGVRHLANGMVGIYLAADVLAELDRLGVDYDDPVEFSAWILERCEEIP